ncbi:hypothetical protein [Mycobacterium sp.]|uniref:hypothetical protein n=1 Tax=Mycobacterium sp. TaxID=1785 RepID=UPI002D967828|nr:hypothetical protein [Mycobacterium sp.]
MASGFAPRALGNPADMRHIDSHRIALAGVLVTAVLAALLILPSVGRMSTLDGAWQAAAIFGLPTVAVLTVTGYRNYGWARSLAVAVAIMLITGFFSWVVTVFVVASALSGSTIGAGLGIVLYGIPALSVVILGLLALKLVPGRSSADRQFDHVGSG